MSAALDDTDRSTSQSDDNNDDQMPIHDPPPYDDVEASYRLFGTIQTVLNSERGEDDDPVETENMRKFLLYCLSVDYRFVGNYELPTSEREKYVELWDTMAKIRDSHDRTDITEYERCVLGPYLWKYLHKPCKRLSIPVECAVRAIARLVKYSDGMNRYKGCLHGVLHNAGPERLASKLWQDRNIVIPRLAGSELERQGLTAALTTFARQYFVTIDGVDSSISADRAGEWDQDSKVSYSLTARGLYYGLAQSSSIGAAECDYARGCCEILRSCVQDLNQRRGIFPEGKRAHDRRATWNGPGPLTSGHSTDEGLRSHIRGWFWYPECHLPDFFEHRPGRDRCDT